MDICVLNTVLHSRVKSSFQVKSGFKCWFNADEEKLSFMYRTTKLFFSGPTLMINSQSFNVSLREAAKKISSLNGRAIKRGGGGKGRAIKRRTFFAASLTFHTKNLELFSFSFLPQKTKFNFFLFKVVKKLNIFIAISHLHIKQPSYFFSEPINLVPPP